MFCKKIYCALNSKNTSLPSGKKVWCHLYSTEHPAKNVNNRDKDKFTSLDLYPAGRGRRTFRKPLLPVTYNPRSATMPTDQDWGSVWPGPRTFHPATVPLPLRMGLSRSPHTNTPIPDKWSNTELMKIPNFLHLTPPVVERQCAAIRKFCTPWPKGVSYYKGSTVIHVDDPCNVHAYVNKKKEKPVYETSDSSSPGYFPLIVSKNSYLYSGPSIRDIRARAVTVKVFVDDLKLSENSRDKLLRLVQERYDPDTRVVTIAADRCPMYRQNLQYCHYLLTVLRAECEKVEPWEHELERSDHNQFEYSGSSSEVTAAALKARQEADGSVPVITDRHTDRYKQALYTMLNEGETDSSVHEYTGSVLSMFGIESPTHDVQTTHNPSLTTHDSVMPECDITHLPSWYYQERKQVKWISHSWPRASPVY